MNGSTLSVALRALPGLIATAWLGAGTLLVIVFGAGGWQTVWAPRPHGSPSPVPVHQVDQGLPRGLAFAIGIGGGAAAAASREGSTPDP